jgi:heptaprenyl diphosphate synthase
MTGHRPPKTQAGILPPALDEYRRRVTARLGRLAGGLPPPLRVPVHDLASRPGKLLRPMLVGACGAFGTPDPDRLVRLGAVVELVHLASLLHDDMIDQAAVRRGEPAAHTVVGRDQAMMAGLSCFALAGAEAADLGYGLERLVGRAVARLACGEMLDVERAFDTALSIPDYLELVDKKTAELFRLACLLGGLEARAGGDVAGTLAAFGRDFGIAFQIMDDCLDLAEDTRGKPAGTDHALGLFGAPTLYALAEDGSGELAMLLLDPSFSATDLPQVRARVSRLGGLAAATRLARERYEEARHTLDRLPTGPGRDLLVDIASLSWGDTA